MVNPQEFGPLDLEWLRVNMITMEWLIENMLQNIRNSKTMMDALKGGTM